MKDTPGKSYVLKLGDSECLKCNHGKRHGRDFMVTPSAPLVSLTLRDI